MSERSTGGPAFPFHIAENLVETGMTLRDYFAAKAMTGFCDGLLPDALWIEAAAKKAYMVADAMLKARGE